MPRAVQYAIYTKTWLDVCFPTAIPLRTQKADSYELANRVQCMGLKSTELPATTSGFSLSHIIFPS